MARRKPPARFSILALVFVVAGVAILCGLGAWQVERLQWKTQLLARIEALKYAPAEPLNVALNHLQAGQDVDYIRVQTACADPTPAPAARVYSVSDAGPAWRPVVLCRLDGGPYPAILVDLGLEADAARTADAALAAPAQITGVLRAGLPRAPLMVMKPAAAGEYGWRDAAGIGAYLGEPNAAPVFLMLEQPSATPNVRPTPVPIDIPNNHLGYAITWFGLAAALVGVYIAAQMRRRKAA